MSKRPQEPQARMEFNGWKMSELYEVTQLRIL